MGLTFQMNRDLLFQWGVRAAVLLTCLPVHEFAHACAADKLGDDTAAKQGRLTLNPFVHLDLMGGVVLLLAGFGWAKPVPVRTDGFKHPRRDMAIVSAAGPLSNILLAFFMLALFKVVGYLVSAETFFTSYSFGVFRKIVYSMLLVNLNLAVFNLLPIPPLDGYKLFGAVLPARFYFGMMRYERYIMIALFFIMYTGILQLPLLYLVGQLYLFLDFATGPIDLLMGG